MKYYDKFYEKTSDFIRINGVPIIVGKKIKSIDIAKSVFELYGRIELSNEMKRLNKKVVDLYNDFLYKALNGKDYDINIMEERLNELYDKLFYMVCTGKEDTIDYGEDWKERLDKTDENLYIGLIKDERLFKYNLHLTLLYMKMKDKVPMILDYPMMYSEYIM